MKDIERVKLEKQITALSKALANLGKTSDSIRELIILIRTPGWTTPAEFMFTNGALEAATQLAKTVKFSADNILKAGKLVGKEYK